MKQMPNLTKKQIARFWAKVDIRGFDDCWEWTASLNRPGGYGSIGFQGKLYGAHRLSYFFHYNKDPGKMCVCHSCDNPKCVNPNHLWLGTFKEDMLDMVVKGRCNKAKGSATHWSKLTEEQVRYIRQCYAKGQKSQYRLARDYGVTRSTIADILKRRSWKHI